MKYIQSIFNVFFFIAFLMTVWFANTTSRAFDYLYTRTIEFEQRIYNIEIGYDNLIKGMNDLQYNQEQVAYMSLNAKLKSDILKNELDTLTNALIEASNEKKY